MNILRGRLYLADLDPRHGTEAGKLRPVVVIQTDLLNSIRHPSTWIVPCTTRCIGSNQLRVAIPAGAAGNREDCEVLVDQSRAIDNRRFKRALRVLPATILREIEEKLRQAGDL
jgi:mRNA interferase MazF